MWRDDARTARSRQLTRRWGKLAVALATVLLAGTGCAANPFTSSEDGEGVTRIRLLNSSPFTLTEVTFSPGLQEPLRFSRIERGAATTYAIVPNAYRYGYLDLLVDGVHRRIQPIDYVGEEHVGAGSFTYVITVDERTLNPGTQLVRDR